MVTNLNSFKQSPENKYELTTVKIEIGQFSTTDLFDIIGFSAYSQITRLKSKRITSLPYNIYT